jgi:hypothetical protein
MAVSAGAGVVTAGEVVISTDVVDGVLAENTR